MHKHELLSLSLDQLKSELSGLKGYKAQQIYIWLHQKNVFSFEEMTNISKADIKYLQEKFYIDKITLQKKQVSKDGTIKFLYALSDKNCIETVLLKYEQGYTVCISTQVGCRMGCSFCASTKNGLVRNLTVAEMALQVYMAAKEIGARITSLVLMGIGEPLDNYENTVAFLHQITNEQGYNMSRRGISLSTCGLVPEILKLAQEKLPLTLSVSLHATSDTKRKQLMPIANSYTIQELLSAVREYQNITSRRISIEYAIIDGINETEVEARRLIVLLKGINAHVNIIPVNGIAGNRFSPAQKTNIDKFAKILSAAGIEVTVRRKLGNDISAACGQLRHETINHKS